MKKYSVGDIKYWLSELRKIQDGSNIHLVSNLSSILTAYIDILEGIEDKSCTNEIHSRISKTVDRVHKLQK